jgi:hypothetical protein
MIGFPDDWIVTEDGSNGVIHAEGPWFESHLTTDSQRTVIDVERSGVADGWRVVEGVLLLHPDGSVTPDDWPSVEWHPTREEALAMAQASARGTWAESCPTHGWEVVLNDDGPLRTACGWVVPGMAPRSQPIATDCPCGDPWCPTEHLSYAGEPNP